MDVILCLAGEVTQGGGDGGEVKGLNGITEMLKVKGCIILSYLSLSLSLSL